ncbi:hypothetical protein ACFWVU_28270 [Streptomyces sp. NPDC058686]|uniref:hypothetical protein n=1 Tax=Streptomyces sp. NPDC058686 TaxID=3346599 RepID=UPI003648CBBB
MTQSQDLPPGGVEALTAELLRLGQQIDRSERPEDLANILTPIVDRSHGALHLIAQIFDVLATTCADFAAQDSYANDLQDLCCDAYSDLADLRDRFNGLDEQFRTFSPDVTRIPRGQRPVRPW